MGELDALFDYYNNNKLNHEEQINLESLAVNQKAVELVGEDVYLNELEELIMDFAGSVEKRGFQEGFRCAVSLLKECAFSVR